MPALSKRRAYVDFPDPAGPHMNMTRLTDEPYVDDRMTVVIYQAHLFAHSDGQPGKRDALSRFRFAC
jgi:hypothetical protein